LFWYNQKSLDYLFKDISGSLHLNRARIFLAETLVNCKFTRPLKMNQAKIYVGNLNYQTSEEDLREVFVAYGEIVETKLIVDSKTGYSKGFAFITFENADSAQSALELNETTLDQRKIKVSLAKEDRAGAGPRRGGGGGGGYNRERTGYDSRR
jgi:cold-inducible RNA-binding protein